MNRPKDWFGTSNGYYGEGVDMMHKPTTELLGEEVKS